MRQPKNPKIAHSTLFFACLAALGLALALAACGDNGSSSGTSDAGLQPGADGGTTGGPDAGGTGGGPDAAGTGGPIDLSGTWISHVTTSGTITAPVVAPNGTTANIDLILRIVVTKNASNLNEHVEFCRLNTASTGANVNFTINFPTNVLTLLVSDATTPSVTVTPGSALTIPSFHILVGENAAGTQVDADGDGNAGVTVPVALGNLAIMSFDGFKIDLSFPSATIVDANNQMGSSAFTTSGTVFGTNPAVPNNTGPISVAPDHPTTPFTAKHLAGNIPCTQVVTMF
jgi:hypothetical protein